MSTWRSFTSKAAFDTWHATEKAARGYPLPGRNAKTGAVQPLSIGPTTDIVSFVQVDATDVRTDVGGLVQEVRDAQGVVIKALPGAASWAPTIKADGTIDVVNSKVDPGTAQVVIA